MQPFARFFVITGILLTALFGVLSITNAIAPDNKDSVPASLPDNVLPESIDDIYGRIAADVPEFGGMYIDKGILYINMTDQTQTLQNKALSEITQIFGKDLLTDYQVVIRGADYGFTQLQNWYGPFREAAFSIPEVSSTTIDEKNNCLKVGIETLDKKASLEEVIRRAGIPLEAVTIEQMARFTPDVTLNDMIRPLLGGLKITSSAGSCTLGFGGIRSSIWGFVTNSHCTTVMGQNNGTVFSQGGDYIGTEGSSSDPAFFSGGACPSGKLCRYSDSAYINKSSLDLMSVGRIAKPTASDHTEPIDWNGTDKFRIVGERPSIIGETVEKIGMSTGRTGGVILNTCVDQGTTAGPNYLLLCQDIANYSSASGDSGSAVFHVTNSPSTNDVLLVGIHWGSSETTRVYSPIGKNNIKRSSELGGFVTADNTICPNCRNWDHYYVWRGGSQSSNKAVWWSANEFIARYPEVKYVQFNSGGGSSGWADSAYVKFCPDLNANGEPINCIGEKYVSNINDYGTTTVTYSPTLQLQAGKKYWLSVNTGGSQKVLLYYSNYGTTDYTQGCNKWNDGTLNNSCSIDLNGTVEATGY